MSSGISIYDSEPPLKCRRISKEEIDGAIKEFIRNKYCEEVDEFGFIMVDGKVIGAMADLK